ncbi:MAG: HEAT repeat domain-containing protein [Candidatus Omnitrophota bacterium]
MKTKLLLPVLAVIVCFLIVNCAPILAAELTSKQLKDIENAIKKIKDKARGVQKEGYDELLSIGPDATSQLIDLLKDKTVEREALRQACNLLGEYKTKDKEAVTVLIYTLKNPSYTVRAAACEALGKIADQSAAEELLGMLVDEESLVREKAAYALISFDNKTIPGKVCELLKDKDESVRVAAITLLNEKLDPATINSIINTLQKDKAPKARQIAARALGGLKKKETVDVLMESVVEDSDNLVREECASALGQINDAKAVPALIEAIKDGYKDVQLKALYSLKKITGQDFGRDYEKWSHWYKK